MSGEDAFPKAPADASLAERRTWRAVNRWLRAERRMRRRVAVLKERARIAHEKWAEQMKEAVDVER